MEAMNVTILQEVSILLYSTANCSTAANQEKTTTQVTNCYGCETRNCKFPDRRPEGR